jgi:ribosomal protein S18 acetylase RimI-like enzyme
MAGYRTQFTDQSPALTVRALTPDDAPAYRAVRLAGMADTPALFSTSAAAESKVAPDQMRQRLAHTRFQRMFGAFLDGELVGIAGYRREPIGLVHDTARIWGVYVLPAARRQGVARAMVAAALEHATGIPELATVTLAVAHDNPAARRLYLALGFSLQPMPDAADGMDRMAIRLPGRSAPQPG